MLSVFNQLLYKDSRPISLHKSITTSFSAVRIYCPHGRITCSGPRKLPPHRWGIRQTSTQKILIYKHLRNDQGLPDLLAEKSGSSCARCKPRKTRDSRGSFFPTKMACRVNGTTGKGAGGTERREITFMAKRSLGRSRSPPCSPGRSDSLRVDVFGVPRPHSGRWPCRRRSR